MAGLAAVLTILAFFFKREHDGKIEAQAALQTAESDKKDAVLGQAQIDVAANLAKEEVQLQGLELMRVKRTYLMGQITKVMG